jgi:glycosyltransferase involved in cell wall biosynthesis
MRVRNPKLISVPVSDGFVEAGNFDLVHFPAQTGYVTALPTIYQPWDLQHLHHPEFFSEFDFQMREKVYRTLCRQACCVCVQTEWCKQDIVKNYGMPPAKIAIIRWGVAMTSHAELAAAAAQAVVKKFGLPAQFFFYPAVSWPHKNHQVILRALEILRREGRVVHACFTGAITEYREQLDALSRQLGVSEQVHYLGYVSSEELQAIYASATAMVFASRFEGFGLPLLEAFQAQLPVLCAKATVLPEIGQDGPLYFDADAPEQLAGLMRTMLDDADARRERVARGKRVLLDYSMQQMAANFQDLYRRVDRESRALTPASLSAGK